MLRWSVLAAAAAVNVPMIWQGFVAQSVPVEDVLVRLLITVPIVAVLLGFVRSAFAVPQGNRRNRALNRES